MLRSKFLFFENLFGLFFLLQTSFPEQLSTHVALSGFILLSILKHFIEGFRVTYLLFILIQFLIFQTTSTYLHLLFTALAFIGIYYFPVYKYPQPTGKYKIGYKSIEIPGVTTIGVYYPTYQSTEDIKYSPTHQAWKRFAVLMRFYAEALKKRKIPWILFRVAFGLLEHQYLGVNKDASIAREEEGEETKQFPCIVFSHGLSANIHIYSILLKEWASNGFIIFSVDHEEEIHIDTSKIKEYDDYVMLRKVQYNDRKMVISRVLDLVSNPLTMFKLFGEKNIALNYQQLFLSGHSLGAANVGETGVEDPRVTGGLLLLDPWFDSSDKDILYQPIDKPILTLRSSEYDKVEGTRSYALKHAEINSSKGLTLSGFFKDSSHNSPTDMIILMPRELVLFGVIKTLNDLVDQIVTQSLLTKTFLAKALEYNENPEKSRNRNETFKQSVLNGFRKSLEKTGIEDTFLVDG